MPVFDSRGSLKTNTIKVARTVPKNRLREKGLILSLRIHGSK